MAISIYEQDYYAWTQQQADLMRTRRYRDLDMDHLIEEIESMGVSERRQLVDRLKVLIAHLLKMLDPLITKAYRLARLLAVKETNLEEDTFPEKCPYSREQIADETFYPS